MGDNQTHSICDSRRPLLDAWIVDPTVYLLKQDRGLSRLAKSSYNGSMECSIPFEHGGSAVNMDLEDAPSKARNRLVAATQRLSGRVKSSGHLPY